MNIREKIISLLAGLDEKQKYYLLGGVLFLVVILDYTFLMRSQVSTLMNINPKIKVLSGDIKQAQFDMERIGQYKKDVLALKDEVKAANLKVTSKEEVPLILEKISRIANKNGITIDQLSPFSEGEDMLLESGNRHYFSLPIIVDAQGGYHDFGRFLNELQGEDVFLTLGTFSIAATEVMRKHKLKIALNAVVYEDVRIEE